MISNKKNLIKGLLIFILLIINLFILPLTIYIKAENNMQIQIEVKGQIKQKYQIGLAYNLTDQIVKKGETTINNSLTTYHDNEGYQYIMGYTSFTNYAIIDYEIKKDIPFKILILTSNNTLFVTKPLNTYAYNSRYSITIDESNYENEIIILDEDQVQLEHNIKPNIIKTILRIIIYTITIILIIYLYKLTEKKIIITSLIIHNILNLLLNIVTTIISHYNGFDIASDLFIIFSIILIICLLLFNFLLIYKKINKDKATKIGYIIISSLLPFITTFIILLIVG